MKRLQIFLLAALTWLGRRVASDTGKVQEALFATDKETQDVIVTFGSIQDMRNIATHIETNYADYSREDRIYEMYKALDDYSKECQTDARDYLDGNSYSYQAMWSTNSLIIREADQGCVSTLAEMGDVNFIKKDSQFPLLDPLEDLDTMAEMEAILKPSDTKVEGRHDAANTSPTFFTVGVSWGLQVMRVEEAWKYGSSPYGYGNGYNSYFGSGGEIKNGTGIVVATIDTGVRGDHEALKHNQRPYASWLDGYNESFVPVDDAGHGTHTMGTICGHNGIGVAPGAQWIACRGCRQQSCLDSALLQCCEWMLCPYDPREPKPDYKHCSTAPDLVSNSWGGGQGDFTFERCALALRTAGIIPIFSIGNSGPDCGTANSPGDLDMVIAVGATDSDDALAFFSSRGPTVDDRLKPDVCGPGVKVRSSWMNGTDAYISISGTSMACPHVSGLVALILERCRLPFTIIVQILQDSSVKTTLGHTSQVCGGVKSDEFPNQFLGYGRVSALGAITLAVQLCQKTYGSSSYYGQQPHANLYFNNYNYFSPSQYPGPILPNNHNYY